MCREKVSGRKMGKYTILDNEKIDSEVQRILNAAVREICKAVDVIAIILTGSFGRGEGTFVSKNNSFALSSDFEICVVAPGIKNRETCKKLTEKLSKQLCADISVAWVTPERIAKNKNGNATFGRSHPSILTYELKSGSKILYGQDVLSQNLTDPTKIPLWEGLRLLFNRMAESLVEQPSLDFQLYAEKWINKTLLACGDFLLLDKKLYHYSYQERGRRLSTQVDFTDYPFLDAAQQADLINAYDVKLRGAYDTYGNNDVTRFYKTIDGVFRYAISNIMKVSFSSYTEFPGRYLSAKAILRKMYKYKFYFLVHPAYENLIYMAKLVQWGRAPSMKVVARMRVAWHHFAYSLIPPLYFFELLSCEERENILSHANRMLLLFNEIPGGSIDTVKNGILRLWFNLCWGKNV
jgi:hypothetical protein